MTMATTNADPDLSAVFAALGNDTRRSLVSRLSDGEATIMELAEPYSMTLAAVSKHLRVLERAGLVTLKREGKSRRCRLHQPTLDEAEAWLIERRNHWTATLDSFADYVEQGQDADQGPDADQRGHR